jgi:hypothetical protein
VETGGPFGAASSWQKLDLAKLSPLAKGFHGASFDGRYVCFVPHSNGSYNGLVVRYDTTEPFIETASWGVFDLATINSAAKGNGGGVFDGRYLYLVRYTNAAAHHGLVARFDAKQPPRQPKLWQASFY